MYHRVKINNDRLELITIKIDNIRQHMKLLSEMIENVQKDIKKSRMTHYYSEPNIHTITNNKVEEKDEESNNHEFKQYN